MTFPPRKSLTRRALVRIGLIAGAGLVLSTILTYRIVYDALEETRLGMLNQDAREGARREEERFVNAEAALDLLRSEFAAHLARGPAPDDAEWFAARLSQDPDGAVRTRRETVDPVREATTWIRAGTAVTPEIRWLVRLSQQLCETYIRVLHHQVQSLYVTSPLQFNSGIAPTQPEWVWETAADFDQNAHEWGRLGGPEENPDRKPLWTGVAYDAQAAGPDNPHTRRGLPFVTLCAPIDAGNRHLVTLHCEVYFMELVNGILSGDRNGIRHMVLRRDGRLIVHPDWWDAMVAREEPLTVAQTADRSLQNIFAALSSGDTGFVSGYDPAGGLHFGAQRMRGPDWWYVSVMPAATLGETAFRSAQWVLWTGTASLAFVLGTLAVMLRREIARPLQALLQATRRLASGDAAAELAINRADEFGELAAAFDEMTRQVAGRDAELRAEKAGLESRVSERTAELQAALERAHELTRLKSSFVSMVSHEYRTPLGVIPFSADILARYLDRLDADARSEHLDAIRTSATRMTHMLEDVLLAGRPDSDQHACQPDDLHLLSFCRRLLAEQRSITRDRWSFRLDADDSLPLAFADARLPRHILTNLLSNAAAYSPPGTRITLRLRRDGTCAEISAEDEGERNSAGGPRSRLHRLPPRTQRHPHARNRAGTRHCEALRGTPRRGDRFCERTGPRHLFHRPAARLSGARRRLHHP